MTEFAEMAMKVTIAEMKANLPDILKKAAGGEEIHVVKDGKPYVVVRREAPEEARPARKVPRVGAFEGEFEVPELDEFNRIPTGFEPYLE